MARCICVYPSKTAKTANRKGLDPLQNKLWNNCSKKTCSNKNNPAASVPRKTMEKKYRTNHSQFRTPTKKVSVKPLLALPHPLTWVLAPAAILNSPGNQVCEETNLKAWSGVDATGTNLIQFAGGIFRDLCCFVGVSYSKHFTSVKTSLSRFFHHLSPLGDNRQQFRYTMSELWLLVWVSNNCKQPHLSTMRGQITWHLNIGTISKCFSLQACILVLITFSISVGSWNSPFLDPPYPRDLKGLTHWHCCLRGSSQVSGHGAHLTQP